MMYQTYQLISETTENVYYSSWAEEPSSEDLEKLDKIIKGNSSDPLSLTSNLHGEDLTEYGPRLNVKTPWSVIAKEIIHSTGLKHLERIEKAIRTKDPNWKDSFDALQMEIYPSTGLTSWRVSPFDFDYQINYQTNFNIELKDISKYNLIYGLSLDDRDIHFYTSIYKKLGRIPTNLELYDLGQSNSEHSRHWTFNSYVYVDGERMPETMFQLVKKPYKKNPGNSLVAFSDNSSVIKGFKVYENERPQEIDFCFTAETHNFPTGVCPFPGAATGIGGRIRDVIATGRGASMIAGTAGYSVGTFSKGDQQTKEEARNMKILIEASNGASDYGNKVGEPIILGYTRTFTEKDLNLSFRKPIMFTGGLGHIYHQNLYKNPVEPNLIIVRAGGPTYRIGLGGGSASSRNDSDSNKELDYQAVQRGDPEMENRLTRFVSKCAGHSPNPIQSIHDQGAGGMANVTKEIVSPLGGIVQLNEVRKGDPTLSTLELWSSESQEQVTFLVKDSDVPLIYEFAAAEGLELELIGQTNETGLLEVCDGRQMVGSFDLDLMLENIPAKIMRVEPRKPVYISDPTTNQNQLLNDLPRFLTDLVKKVLGNVTVGSKSFLVNKVDRSVSGLVAQQQTVGRYQVPISDYALVATSYKISPENGKYTGTLLGIGEQPLKGLNQPERMVEMTFGEMLLNMIGAKIPAIDQIRISGNWMWSPKEPGYGHSLYLAVERLSKLCCQLGPVIDGGKDSLSMVSRQDDGTKIISPATLVLSGYAPVPDLTVKVNSGLVETSEESILLLIDFGEGKNRLGGSILAQEYFPKSGLTLSEDFYPRMDSPELFRKVWTEVQNLIAEEKILAVHDRSDGGLITTLIEMSLANNIGLRSSVKRKMTFNQTAEFYFNEELGLVIQILEKDFDYINSKLSLKPEILGPTTRISISIPEMQMYWTLLQAREIWEKRSYQLELQQANPKVIKNEYESLALNGGLKNYLLGNLKYPPEDYASIYEVTCLILRQDGSNGDREMQEAFNVAGFKTTNAKTSELLNGLSLEDFDCLALVGGFSNGDVLGSANGWAQMILENPKLKNQFDQFYQNPKKFSLGVCNGFQLMTRLGWFGDAKLEENDSERFESRWLNLEVSDSLSPHSPEFIKNLNGVRWGCWVAHGEGKLTSLGDGYPVITYQSARYPYNPNGSIDNVAGLLSQNGRHLGMMPHPERSFLKWQNAWLGNDELEGEYSPWYWLFRGFYGQVLTTSDPEQNLYLESDL